MRKLGLVALCFLVWVTIADATPPSKIDLSYDAAHAVLNIDVAHISHNVNKHYIRRIIVYKNDEEVASLPFPAQHPTGQSASVNLNAVKDDTIRVKAICSEAGTKEETLVIP